MNFKFILFCSKKTPVGNFIRIAYYPTFYLFYRKWGMSLSFSWIPLKCIMLPHLHKTTSIFGIPRGLSGKESTCQCRKHRFDPWVEKIPWSRAWHPIPVFLPGESRGQRKLAGYSPQGHKSQTQLKWLITHAHISIFAPTYTYHDPDNHNGVITHLEPDILKCEVKWALDSSTMNKVSGGDGIPIALFQILKDDAVKVYARKFGKLSSGHGTGKGQFSFQSQRKAMRKNAQTAAQLYSSHTLVKKCS